MANRFFNAGDHQYTSQFVPENLPLDMMMTGLANRQASYNQAEAATLAARAAFKERAVGTTHKAKVKELETQFDEFVNKNLSGDVDLSSPEFRRDYLKFSTDFANNPELGTIRARTANYDALVEEEKALRGKSGLHAARHHRVLKQLEKINSDKDEFSDILGDAIIGEEVDIQKSYEEIFNHIKESGWESIDDFKGVYYKHGWKGISGSSFDRKGKLSKISQTAMDALDIFSTSAAGRQELMEYERQVDYGYIDPNEVSSGQFIMDRMMGVGDSFATSKPTSGLAAAMNAAAEVTAQNKITQQPEIPVPGSKNFMDYGQVMGEGGKSKMLYQTTLEAQELQTTQLAPLEEALNAYMDENIAFGELEPYDRRSPAIVTGQNQNLKPGELPSPHRGLSDQAIAAIENAPGGLKILEGTPLSMDEHNAFTGYMNNLIEPLKESVFTNQRTIDKIETDHAKAIDEVYKLRYNGMTSTQLIQKAKGEHALIGDYNDISVENFERASNELEAAFDEIYTDADYETPFWGGNRFDKYNKDKTGAHWIGVDDPNSTEGRLAPIDMNTSWYNENVLSNAQSGADLREYPEGHETPSKKYETWFRNNIKQDLDNGKITAPEYNILNAKLQAKLDAGYLELARTDLAAIKHAASNPNSKNKVRDAFNKIQESAEPTAYMMPSTREYARIGANGKKESVERGEYRAQDLLRTNPENFKWTIDGKPLEKGGLDGVDMSNLQITAIDDTNTDPVTNHISYLVSGTRTVLAPNQKILVNKNEEQVKETPIEFKATVSIKDPLTDASIRENIVDAAVHNYNSNPLTLSGQHSFNKVLKLSDPKFAEDISNMAKLAVGEEYKFHKEMNYYEPNDPRNREQYTWKVEKTSQTGDGYLANFNITGYVPDFENGGLKVAYKTRPMPSTAHLGQYIISLDQKLAEEAAAFNQ